MAGPSSIEWTDATWNPVTGCTKVSPGCKNCYAERMARRLRGMGQPNYVNSDGDISNYIPDFLVRLSDKRLVVVETKGQEELDVPLKMERLRQWCEDVNRVQQDVVYDFVYVDEESFGKYKPTSFRQLLDGFREYKAKA